MKNYHIGKLIQFQTKLQRLSAIWLAKRIHCNRQNIYKIFAKDDISVNQLDRIADALDYDFFADLSENFQKRRAAKQA